MKVWREIPGSRSRVLSPIGLRLVDTVTGDAPIGRLSLRLDHLQGTEWVPTTVRAVFTPGGFAAYPGLGRTRDPVGKGPARYRARVDAELYRARYAPPAEGFEFDVHPYNDVTPPAAGPVIADALLAPAPHYPFEPQVPVIHGVVKRGGQPVADVLLSAPGAVAALSDERGVFSLALVRGGLPGTLDITVTPRGGAATVNKVTLPSVLNQCLMILLP